jgi:hypothetical protein
MQRNRNAHQPNDDRLRLYVALLLITAYVVLILLLPWVPAARDPLIFLGPFAGAIVGYAFGQRTNSPPS